MNIDTDALQKAIREQLNGVTLQIGKTIVTEALNVTPEQSALIEKIRASAWKDYLNEKRWCAWFQGDRKPDGDGFAKVPLGSHSDPATWSTFEEVIAKLKTGQGIGYNFLGGELHPLDLDHVRNPQTGMVCNEAMVLLSRLKSFSEVSVSGRGIHVLFKGSVRGHQLTTTCVQYWNPAKAPRFFTVTGEVVGDAFSTIQDVGDEFNYLFSTANHISAKCREELKAIDPEQYEKLPAEPVKKETASKERKSSDKKRQRHPDFNMEEFLSWAGLPIDNVTTNEIGKCYRVTSCPIKGEAHVGQNSTTTNFILSADGGIAFHCQSTGCVEYHFADGLKMLEEKLGKYPGKLYEEKKTSQVKQTITIHRADTIKRESTKWLIPGFVPLCEATAFSGEMDTRKSTTALDIAAKGSKGFRWSQKMGDTVITPAFSTIYAGTEDSFHSTVLNRFIAAGGDTKAFGNISLEVVNEKNSPDGVETWSSPLSFDAHLNVLHEAITNFNKEAAYPVGLLINDPLIAFFGDKNFNKAQDCQVILKGLKRLCEELNISIINLMHFNKTQGATAKEKTGGSQRLIEAHRMAWSFTLLDDTDKNSNTLVAPIKKNLLKVAKSYEITTVSTPVEWLEDGVKKHDEVGVVQFVRLSDETTEGHLLEKASKDRSKHREVSEGILDALKPGASSPANVIKQLEGMASKATIERQANKLIKSGKIKSTGKTSNALWMLAAEPHQAQFDTSH